MSTHATVNSASVPNPGSKRRILLIEDNDADATIAKMVHDEVKACSWLDIVYSSADAMRLLRGAEQPGSNRPDVILLDMHMPVKTGLELITEIRSLPGYDVVPIVIISGSENPVTLREAYQLGANCVVKKSSSWDEYFRKLETCYEFWCGVAELPHPPKQEPSN